MFEVLCEGSLAFPKEQRRAGKAGRIYILLFLWIKTIFLRYWERKEVFLEGVTDELHTVTQQCLII